MYTKIHIKTKVGVHHAQSRALTRLIATYPNITSTAVAIGVNEMTMRNWLNGGTRYTLMSASMAVHIEEVTADRGAGKRFKRGRFRPDLFVKGWTPT